MDTLAFKKIDPREFGELLYQMDIKAFTRNFDYPSPSIPMTLDYLKDCDVYLVYEKENPVGLFAYTEKNNEVEVNATAK